MLCRPIDVAPFAEPDHIIIDFHEDAIGNDGSTRVAPIVVRGIDELNVVIIRIAIDQVETGVILKDVVGDISSRVSLVALDHDFVPVILNRILV